ncbi:HprK-related kinase A [Chromatium okenii]|uniref:HprK-related kinase A n=1 Tax=Chromatium okenii TaxID=61644 RepID=UPI001F5B6C75|nr:HprK-related kinase A [Chromatium okenii]MBK1642075.1 HprK-related kinase A [Chromatium okenii]
MMISELTATELQARLTTAGLCFGCGPFRLRLNSSLRLLFPVLHKLYAHYPVYDHSGVDDYRMTLDWASPLRRWLRPVVRFSADGPAPFTDVSIEQAFPTLEWGMNWCIAVRAHHVLMLHAAVVERHGRVLVLPAAPGSGKSTLCAALSHSGWRLFSDEFGLVQPEDATFIPIPRLISLKNQSINVIRQFSATAHIGSTYHGTHKGSVAHIRPPLASITRMKESAPAGWVIFPRWQAGAALTLQPIAKDRAFMMIASNAFNYEVLGELAFKAVAHIVKNCEIYSLVYSDLAQAIHTLDDLTQ